MKQTVLADLKRLKLTHSNTKNHTKKKTKHEHRIEEPNNTPLTKYWTKPKAVWGNANGFLCLRRAGKWGKVDFPELKLCFSLWFTWFCEIVKEQKQTSRVSLVTSGVLDFLFNQATKMALRKTSRGKVDSLADGQKHIQRIFGLIPTRTEQNSRQSCHEL